ncbi:Taurine import ATP-binding protein TauB [bacterium HR39]|nr:Taurine import ATP-binding protein TauB [bacterium HR39]
MTETGAALVLRGVRHVWPNGIEALADLDLVLADGSFTALVGPSGCGKSTTLRIAAGLLAPSAGEVRRAPDGPGAVAVVFQDPVLLPWTHVLGNIALPLRLLGLPRAERERRALDALRLVGLDSALHLHPDELSGGMRMRVSVARALATEPRLLLMDEPFAALDEITRFALDTELLRLWVQRRFTVLFVTHSVYEAVFLAERVLVMSPRPGRIVREIPVDEPHPRARAFRASVRFAALCGEVLEALEAAGGDP